MHHILKSNIVENIVKPGENYENLEEKIYKIIKDKIIYHKIKPGERVIDKNIAEELGVSRSLIRQVLGMLTKEEIVKVVPRKGFYVKEITKKEVEEIYDVRKILESYAIGLSVLQITDEDFQKIEELFKIAKKDLDEEETTSFIETDLQMHKLFIDKCGNELLKKIIAKYNDRYIFYRISDLTPIENAKKSYFEHYEIFKVAKSRDSKSASELMMKHIEHCKQNIIDNFDKYTYGNNFR